MLYLSEFPAWLTPSLQTFLANAPRGKSKVVRAFSEKDDTPRKGVRINGVIYKNAKEACAALAITRLGLEDRLEDGRARLVPL
jgi:hypothetical protein